MLFNKLFMIFLFFKAIESWEDKSALTIEIESGKVLGRYMTSKSGKPVKAFLGIPYAKPPVEDLRFKAPQKVEPWSDVKTTQIDSPVCVQFNPFARDFKNAIGQEDCLYLNVYVPGRKNMESKFSVIYWIHGGGWTRGEASNHMYGHQNMLDHDIILVSGNYRVGPLGFLSTENKNSPGNQGFKDQNFILKWIQENIESFGGDKDSVTIWGESAGGASVAYHMQFSQGLFHKAISHSGSLNQCWSDPARKGEALAQTIRLANELQCPTTDNETMINCLRNVPAYNLTLAIANLYYWDYDPVVLFLPVVEDFETDEEKFISSRTFNENSTSIPWLTGMNSEESLLKLASILDNQTFYNELIEKFDEILPYSFYYHDIEPGKQEEVTKALNKFYFGSEAPTTRETQDLLNLFTDAWFLGFTEALKQRFTVSTSENTFVYLFTHKGTSSFSVSSKYYGTSHVDDLIPFFPMNRNIFFSSIPTKEDRELEKLLPEMWVNFAKTGNPNIQSSSIEWPVATSFPIPFMQIGNENGKKENLFEVKTDGFYTERADFWMELRTNYSLNRWL